MSTRPQFSPYICLPNAYSSPANNNSMAISLISQPTIVQKLSMISYSCVWSGSSPVGTISVEASDDYSLDSEGAVKNVGTWNPMPLTYLGTSVTTIPVSGNSGNGLIDIAPTGVYAIRLIYTATSGTGNITVTITAKVS